MAALFMDLLVALMYPRINKLIFDEWQEVYGIAARETNYILLNLL